MHYGDIEHRPIYGEASPEEARSLIDEGVEVSPLPVLPDDRTDAPASSRRVGKAKRATISQNIARLEGGGHGARAPLPTLRFSNHTATSIATPITISAMPDNSRADSACLNE